MWSLGIVTLVTNVFCLVLGQNDIRMPPAIVRGPSKRNVIYRSDDSVVLECKGNGVPGVTYDWKKNGFELNQNLQNILKGTDGTITIQPATSMDEGFYQCFATNQYGTALSITTHIQRALLDSSAGTPTVLQKTVQQGMPFHIQAEPRKSFPKPTYGWEMAADTVDKNPIALRPSKRIQIAENGDLHFAYALPEDALGERMYKCTTYNPYLDVKAGGSYTKLTVTPSTGGVINQFAPTIGFASEAQTVAVIGGSETLRCFFSGYPEPTISWSGPRNTLPIGRYTLNRFKTELTINNITALDEGDYVCTASNTQGLNTHTLQLRVEDALNKRRVESTLPEGPPDPDYETIDGVILNPAYIGQSPLSPSSVPTARQYEALASPDRYVPDDGTGGSVRATVAMSTRLESIDVHQELEELPIASELSGQTNVYTALAEREAMIQSVYTELEQKK